MKLLKDIRDVLEGGIAPRSPRAPRGSDDGNDDSDNDDDDGNMPDLETEKDTAERISINSLNKFKNNIEIEMSNLDKIAKNKENEFSTKLNKIMMLKK